MAADDRTAAVGTLSPGQAGDAPRGRQLLRELGLLADHDLLPEEPALVMDRACEGDKTRWLAAELVVPPRSDRC